MARARRKFDEDFKATACARVITDGESVGAVAEDLDLTETSFRGWLKARGWTPGAEPARGEARKAKPGGKAKRKAPKIAELPDEVAGLVVDLGGEIGGMIAVALGKAYEHGVTAGRVSMVEKIGALLGGES